MITREQIQDNANKFEELVNSITREGFDKEALLRKLENSDFYTAPASSKYHCSYEGGLVDHCLNVYYSLCTLINSFNVIGIDNDSIIICALFHDFSKMNYYEKTSINKKVYSPDGKKYDELGKFDWIAVPGYSTKAFENRFIYGSHEQAAEFMTRTFIPLTVEESVAILHHMGGQAWDSAKDNLSEVYTKYPLALLLHLADMISTYYLEGNGSGD